MLIALYSLLLTAGLALSAPWWLFRMATTERYREGLRQRLGAVPLQLREAVQGKRVVWIHAVSVGEVLAASRLVAELGAALGDRWVVVVSTTTRTGQALARERFGAERVFYMPLDFAFAVRRYMRVLRPAVLVLMESELWPRLLHECQRAGVPVAVVNARVSDRSFARGTKLRVLWGRALKMVSLWLAQSEEDARRLVAMGARADVVKVGGNLKYDVRAPKESRVAELIKEAAAGRPVIVAGSTVVGEKSNTWEESAEEARIMQAWGEFAAEKFRSLLVLGPRHPERFQEVKKYAGGYPSYSATELIAGDTSRRRSWPFRRLEEDFGPEIIVLNTIGDLAAVYEIADVAFVGGSLVKRGGHNPLEPAQFGVPVIIGPSYENFRDIVATMKAHHAIRIVHDEKELRSALEELLTNRDEAKALGERGRKVFEQQQGATKRAVEAIVELVKT